MRRIADIYIKSPSLVHQLSFNIFKGNASRAAAFLFKMFNTNCACNTLHMLVLAVLEFQPFETAHVWPFHTLSELWPFHLTGANHWCFFGSILVVKNSCNREDSLVFALECITSFEVSPYSWTWLYCILRAYGISQLALVVMCEA